jgi:hypothetical protein
MLIEMGADLYGYHTSTMCGRYTLTADLKKVADRFGATVRGLR